MKLLKRLIPFGISLVVTPFLLFAGLVSAGMGHGDFVLAKVLFPYSFLNFVIKPSSEMVASTIGTFLLIGSIVQYPTYGLVLSLVNKRILAAILLAAVHVSVYALIVLYSGWGFFEGLL